MLEAIREKGLLQVPTLPLDAYSFDSPLVGITKPGRASQIDPLTAIRQE
jgi:hypothetical protein